jgi:hypothetical protein
VDPVTLKKVYYMKGAKIFGVAVEMTFTNREKPFVAMDQVVLA